jgi:hypothetical protein
MAGKITRKPPTRRDQSDQALLGRQADHIRLKAAGDPAHINPAEARLLQTLMPEAAGPVVTRGLLAEAGRRGDDRVTRLIPAEAAALRSRGGAGTRNPATGLLEYNTSGGGGGEGGDNGVGGPGNGSAGTGPGQGVGGNTSFSDNYDVGWSGPESDITDAATQPDWSGYAMNGYKPADTWGRFFQELISPSLPSPGRFDPPTKAGPGIFGSFLSQVTPSLMGMPAFGLAMNIGGAMGRASSTETQAASAAEMGERGSMNSTGNDQRGLSVQEIDAKIAPAGTASGAATAELPQVPPGWTLNPAGQLIPLPGSQGNGRPAYQDAATNTLLDYVLHGRAGGGLLKW